MGAGFGCVGLGVVLGLGLGGASFGIGRFVGVSNRSILLVGLNIPRTVLLTTSGDNKADIKELLGSSSSPSDTRFGASCSCACSPSLPNNRETYPRLGLSSPSEYDLSLVEIRRY